MRHVVVTAGSKGLGRKVSEAFLQKGYSVTINYRSDEEAVNQMQDQWASYSDRIQFVQGDVTNPEDLHRLIEHAYEAFGRIDVLVNNAGPYIFERKKLADYTVSEWDEMLKGNLTAMFHLFQRVIPIMREQQFGRIITYGFQGVNTAPGWLYRSAFGAAKTGLLSLMKTVSIEEAENGITVNMVAPGIITDEMKEASIETAKEINDDITPVGRPGSGEDIARTVLFLTEDEADMITGSVVEVTGGIDVIHRRRSKSISE
ncbi:SDR family oxidoreductase [Salsuginibacillus kocurii]|uniref:SDR family oxidoreductase n=1 Tax=Salsuginibacillus kocurii TaxID=427078 RepID=UPI00035D2AFF|nr:SDR family oxidoreductase [Salsuginibacillus kocurii]